MEIDYVLLDEFYEPSPGALKRIEKKVKILYAFCKENSPGRKQPIILVNGEEFEDSVPETGRALAYVPKTRTINYINGIRAGLHDFGILLQKDKFLEELTDDELIDLCDAYSEVYRPEMLKKLRDLAMELSE